MGIILIINENRVSELDDRIKIVTELVAKLDKSRTKLFAAMADSDNLDKKFISGGDWGKGENGMSAYARANFGSFIDACKGVFEGLYEIARLQTKRDEASSSGRRKKGVTAYRAVKDAMTTAATQLETLAQQAINQMMKQWNRNYRHREWYCPPFVPMSGWYYGFT